MKPKIGLALLCSEWFLETGAAGSNVGDTETFKSIAEKDARAVVETVAAFAEVIYPGVIYSKNSRKRR